MYSKIVLDSFSKQIVKLQYKMHFDSLFDTLQYVIENNIYDFLTYTNVNKFINRSLRDKLLIEFSNKNMIKDHFKKKQNNTLF